MKEKKNNSVSLDYLRMHHVDNLRIAMNQLKACAEETLKKIESEGVSGYYSCNSDVRRYSEKAWWASLALAELKRFEDRMEDEIDRAVETKLKKLLDTVRSDSTEDKE